MKEIKYITFIIIILVGGALVFRYWALRNINVALHDIDKSNTFQVNILDNKPSDIKKTEDIQSTTGDLALENVSSGDGVIKEENLATTILDMSFISPKKDTDLYIGCKYQISLNSSSVISSISMSLNDLGTKKAQGPVASGIAKDITGKDLKNIEWKVGNVWPGKYFILTSSVNGKDFSKKSAVFNINKIPKDINKDKIEEFCKNNLPA